MPESRSTGMPKADVAEGVEAWGFRARRSWIRGCPETEAYMRIAAERYRLLRTHRWDEEVIRRVVEGK